jgi:hypothetical protein
MPRTILIDEFHLSVRAPPGLPERAYLAVHRTLNSNRFQADLRRALRAVQDRYDSLLRTTIVISQ